MIYVDSEINYYLWGFGGEVSEEFFQNHPNKAYKVTIRKKPTK